MDISTIELSSKISELQEMLLADNPRMPVLLREIHTVIKQNPEQVTLLDEASIATVVQGLEKFTGTMIVSASAAKATAKGSSKGLKNLTVDDF